jgi:hypothetical protein
MRSVKAVAVGMLVLVCGVSRAADQAEIKAHYLDMRTYAQSVHIHYLTQECLKVAPVQGALMQAELVQWRTENGEAAIRGSDAMLRLMPDAGKTPAEQASMIRESAVGMFAPDLASMPEKTCKRGLNGIRFNVPVDMRGDTLADRNLRYDIFKQAYAPAAGLMQCPDLEAIETHVVSDKGTSGDRVIEESWIMRGCGKEQRATVVYGPSAGKTSLVVSFPNVSLPPKPAD